MRHYDYMGFKVASDLVLPAPETSTPGRVDVCVRQIARGSHRPLAEFPADLDVRIGPEALSYRVGRSEDALLVHLESVATFRIAVDEVGYEREPGVLDDEVAPYVTNTALSIWIERRGFPVLHGSAVELDGRAVGFLGPSGAGKSVMATAAVARGARLLSDDALVLVRRPERPAWSVRCGPAFVGLWKDAREHFGQTNPLWPSANGRHDKRRITLQPPRPSADAVPLGAIFLLERTDGGVHRLARLSSADALKALIGQSQSPRTVEVAGLQARRFLALADLANAVPVCRLEFPSNFLSFDQTLALVSGFQAES